jgi:hypothetical protein
MGLEKNKMISQPQNHFFLLFFGPMFGTSPKSLYNGMTCATVVQYHTPGEISWHPLTGANIAYLIILSWFEPCLEVCTFKLHVQLKFSLKSPTISQQVLLDVYVILCSTQVEHLKHANLN